MPYYINVEFNDTPNMRTLLSVLSESGSLASLQSEIDELASKLSYLYKIALVIKAEYNVTEDHLHLFAKTVVEYEQYLKGLVDKLTACDDATIEQYHQDMIAYSQEELDKAYVDFKPAYEQRLEAVKNATTQEIRSAIMYRLSRCDMHLLDFQVARFAEIAESLSEADVQAMAGLNIDEVLKSLMTYGCYRPRRNPESDEEHIIKCVENNYDRSNYMDIMTQEVRNQSSLYYSSLGKGR